MSFAAYPLTEIHVAIKQFLMESNVDSMDVLKSFEIQKKPPQYFADDIWHPNKEGHDFIARQALNFVATE